MLSRWLELSAIIRLIILAWWMFIGPLLLVVGQLLPSGTLNQESVLSPLGGVPSPGLSASNQHAANFLK
jgi:hypothetical protein